MFPLWDPEIILDREVDIKNAAQGLQIDDNVIGHILEGEIVIPVLIHEKGHVPEEDVKDASVLLVKATPTSAKVSKKMRYPETRRVSRVDFPQNLSHL